MCFPKFDFKYFLLSLRFHIDECMACSEKLLIIFCFQSFFDLEFDGEFLLPQRIFGDNGSG